MYNIVCEAHLSHLKKGISKEESIKMLSVFFVKSVDEIRQLLAELEGQNDVART